MHQEETLYLDDLKKINDDTKTVNAISHLQKKK